MKNTRLILYNKSNKLAIYIGCFNFHFNARNLVDFSFFHALYDKLMPFQDIIHFYDKMRELLFTENLRENLRFFDEHVFERSEKNNYTVIAISPTHVNYKELKQKYNL